MSRILIAGIGNIFLGDDGFGCEVVRRIGDLPAGVQVTDYGIRGMHLAYDLLDGWDALVLVDALPDRGRPGEIHVFDVDHESDAGTTGLDAHSVDPNTVFASMRALGGSPPRTVIVGCQVANIGDDIGLSDRVRVAVPPAIDAVHATVAMLRADALTRSAD